jgi:16S rRNA processing protein RimM
MASKKTQAAADETGSPTVGEPEYLVVGILRRPHGVKGELLMGIHTDFPERLKAGKTVFVGDSYQPMVIASLRPHAAGLLLRFRGVKTPEDAGHYRNTWVYVLTADRPELPEGEYYHHQLIGLTVVTDEGRDLGVLVDILETGANDVYVVRDAGGTETLLPAIPSVILEIRLADRQMSVHLLDGLI